MMIRWATILSALFAICGVALLLGQYSQQARADTGWTTLFDGNSLYKCNQIGTADWKLEDGLVVADNGNGFLVSKQPYTNFQLRAEFWLEAKTNSGIFIRCTDPNSVSCKTSYDVNIWDQRPQPEYGTGAPTKLVQVVAMPT